MVLITTDQVKESFVEWNGWGPPTSEYQIGEYCRAESESENDYDFTFNILFRWMNES